jgi:DNA-binding NtrC family response regulator
MATILYVDDEPAIGLILEDTLERAGHATVGAHSVPEALQALAKGNVDLIISDYRMPGLTGLEFLELLQQEGYDVPLIMLTGYATIEHAVAAIKAGAVDYITKPVRPEQLELSVAQALEVARLRRENDTLRREVMELRNERMIIGESLQIRRLLQTVTTAAPTRATAGEATLASAEATFAARAAGESPSTMPMAPRTSSPSMAHAEVGRMGSPRHIHTTGASGPSRARRTNS